MNYSTLKELQDYRASPGLSQSFLKMVLTNRVKKDFKETVQMCIGSYMDSLLTSPDLTDDLFQVGLAKRPSEAIKGFLDTHWETVQIDAENLTLEGVSVNININLEVQREHVLMLVREAGYQPNWGDDAIWKSIIKDGQSYWEELVTSKGKVLITSEEKDRCDTISSLVCSSSLTGKYFIKTEGVDKHYQKPLYWTYQDELCKELLDLLIFEHETKTIYIIDLKSTAVESIEDWFRVCKTKKYPFQMAWYREGVVQNYKDLIEEGWKIKCRWLVVPTNSVSSFKPYVISCTDLMLGVGKYGCTKHKFSYSLDFENHVMYPFETIYGFEEAVTRYKKAKEEGLLDYDTEYYKNGGKFTDTQSEQYYFS